LHSKICLPSNACDGRRKRVLGARFDYHLVKPARIDALQSLIDSIQVGQGT